MQGGRKRGAESEQEREKEREERERRRGDRGLLVLRLRGGERKREGEEETEKRERKRQSLLVLSLSLREGERRREKEREERTEKDRGKGGVRPVPSLRGESEAECTQKALGHCGCGTLRHRRGRKTQQATE